MQRTIRTDLVMNVSGYVGPLQQADRATTQFTSRGAAQMQKYSAEMTKVGLAFTVAGTAIGAALVSSARDAIAFETVLTRSVTLAGVTAERMRIMGDEILGLRHAGKGPLELADALFYVQSSGLAGATALDATTQSAKAASIGLGGTMEVAQLVTSAINAYGKENISATQATDTLIAAVRVGKAEAPELASSLGRVIPIASEMGVSFDEVGAAVAAMSLTGTDAATSTTQLRAILSSLLKPAQQSEEALEGIGLSSQMLRDTIREDGLWAALMLLRTSIGGNEAALGRIIPEVRALTGFLSLTGQNAAENAIIFDQLANSTGLTEEAFEQWSETTEAAQERFSSAMEAAKISLGDVFLPAIKGVLDAGTSLANAFTDMSDPVQAFVGIGAAVVALLLVMGGGFLVLAPRIVATRIAMQALAVAAPRAAAGMKALGIAAGTATAVLALVMAFDLLTRSTEFAGLGVEQFRVHIKALEDSGRATVDIENMRDAMERFQNTVKVAGLRVSTEWGSGLGSGTKASNDFRAALELVDQTIAGMVESGEIENFNSAVNRIADIFGISWNEAKRLVEQMPMLREAFASTKGEAAATAEAMTPLDQSLQNLADQFNLTGDESTKAAQEMINEWDGATRDFVDIMDAYKTVLDSAMEKQQDWAQGQADTFNEENPDSPSKSWEDYARDVEVSLGDVNKALEDQLVAMRDWQANLGTLAKRGVDDGLLSELARLGPEGAPLVKALADASDKELEKWVTLMGQRTTEGTNSVATNLIAAQPRLEEISNEMGQEVVNNIIDGMVKNGTTLEQEAERQGINVDKKLSKHGSLKIAPFLDKILFNNANLKLNNLARDRTMDITARITGYEYKGAGSASYPGNARGGEVRGPGGPSDDMAGLFRLSDREWVIRALAAMKYGRDRMRAVNEGTARIILPGEGGTSRFDLLTRGQFDATDFLNRIELAVTRVASSSAAVNGSPGAAGKVLPSGTYRIGRGPAGHGYNARDLPAPIGTPVFAAAAGIVSRAARLATSYGIHAVIQHAGWKTLYAHMSQMYVRAGQNIPRGFMLGRVGSTGNSTGPHLHLEPDLARLYDFGGYLPRGWSLAYNGTGGQERVLTPRESALYSKIVGALQIQTSRSTMPYQLPALPSRSVDQRSYWTINGAPEEIVAKVASRMAYDRIAKESPHD